jgi:ribosomal protein S18 acetylase RimI-like enzyme
MDAPSPGHFWKIPFLWEPGHPLPPAHGALHFEPAPADWLAPALADVMAHSLDESDQAAVAELGARGAADELLAVDEDYFEACGGGWRRACTADGRPVGLLLPVLLKPERSRRDGRRTGSIYYMGVLPEARGRGHGGELLDEATRTFVAAGCWRIFCDTGARNAPMLAAFRRRGYQERAAWERPLR